MLLFPFLNFMLWKNVSMSTRVCMCMYVRRIYWNGMEENELIAKEARNLGLEFSDLNSVARTWNVTDTGILCLAVNESSTLKLYSISVPKQQNALLTRHI